MPDKENFQAVIEPTAIVRRLTPVECERLQAYPDGWTDIGEWTDTKGKVHKESSDSSRYKALGNSIALPFWEWMAKRMIEVLKKDGVESPTMASLFDGIGGFPLVYSRHGCTPVWASEIEEFPIAVTKYHFPENGGGIRLNEKSTEQQTNVIRAVCIGNGQVHDAISPSEEVSKTLNCMCDPMKVVCIEKSNEEEK